jgi:hypothetical protein
VDQPEQLVFGEFDRRYAKGRRLIETVRIVCVDDRRAVKATLEEERNPTVMRQYHRHYRRVIHTHGAGIPYVHRPPANTWDTGRVYWDDANIDREAHTCRLTLKPD